MVICLERGADLHMAQLMPLPLTVTHARTHTHTHTPPHPSPRLMALSPGLPGWARDSEWQWNPLGHMQSAPRQHPTGRMPFLPPNQCQSTEGHSLYLASVKSRLVLSFWYWLTWVVPEKGPLTGVCVFVLLYWVNVPSKGGLIFRLACLVCVCVCVCMYVCAVVIRSAACAAVDRDDWSFTVVRGNCLHAQVAVLKLAVK